MQSKKETQGGKIR